MRFTEFAGFDTTIIRQPVWKAGAPNSITEAKGASVKATGLCLTAGQEYEIEGAVGEPSALARATAVAQDLARVSSQLTPQGNNGSGVHASVDLLCERQPARLTQIAPHYVPVLLAVGDAAERRLGLRRQFGGLSLLEDAHPWRRAVRALRAEGWFGAIQLPGPTTDVSHIVIPRKFVLDGALKIKYEGDLIDPIPRSLVEYALGMAQVFPADDCDTNLNVAGTPIRTRTRSWRPRSLLQEVEAT